MSSSLLERLRATPGAVARLAAAPRMAVIQFLIEWGAPAEALACLAYMRRDAGAQWHLLAADALRRAGRADEAIALLDALRARAPGMPEAHLARIRCRAAAGDGRGAIDAAEALIATAPDRVDVWLLLGDLHLAAGAASNAEVAFTQAQRLRPGDIAPQVGALRAALCAGDSAQAAELALPLAAPLASAALRPDELQALRSALHAGGQEDAAQSVALELVRRFESELDHLRGHFTAAPVRPGAAPARPAPRPASSPGRAPQIASTLTRYEAAELYAAARRLFGFAGLLPLQAEVLAATRRGEDVLAVLPTGGGKSLTYQLPAFMDEGTTLVISPLVALMKDQVERLPPRLRPEAVALHGGLSFAEADAVMEGIAAHRYRLIFVAPERLRRRAFVADLRRAGINRLVVDEAHCVSAWGHDFRPDYLHLAQAHADLGAPPILALTATAPPPVRADILAQLFAPPRTRPLRVLLGDPARPNLWLGAKAVRDETERRSRITEFCRTQAGSGLVYVRSRAAADELAAQLREAGVAAAAYHAGRSDRDAVQDRFMQGRLRVVVATVAFGMGVDKGDIRFILHAGLPTSLEAYAQEVGRAGRDGNPATCMLYYHARDAQQAARFAERDSVDIALLANVLEVITQALGEEGAGLVARATLAAALPGVEETTLRAALQMLEEARLIERRYDAPRSVSLYLRKAARGPVFTRFLATSHLRQGAPVEWPFGELAAATRIPIAALEPRLIEWQEKGYIRYYAGGRELMLTLRATPQATARAGRARLEALLADQRARRLAQVDAVVRFVEGGGCRHAALAQALGSEAPARCNNCDACGASLAQ